MKNSTGNLKPRCAAVRRTTTETRIALTLKLDGTGAASISTGIPFLDHMLTLFARHAVMDLDLSCQGDLAVDGHHTVEDCGLALGQAFREALGGKEGIRRYGTGFDPRNPLGSEAVEPEARRYTPGKTVEPEARRYTSGFDPRNPLCAEAYVPMDECLARCVIDFGGRPFLVWRGLVKSAHKKISAEEKNQDASSAFRFGLAREFFRAFANEARCNLHLELLYGDEPHHIVEALFKAFARATDAACQRDPRMAGRLPSTKGKL